MNKQQAKEKIKGLIAEYDDLKSKNNLKEPRFNEAFAKQRFIQPFFEALGWNFKIDVWPEEKVSKGKVDYSFRIDNFIKFFVEAKKFSEDLEKEEWTKQIIDYSYNKGVTWGVLTNFEKIKLFNSEWNVRPYKPVKEFEYQEYLKRFEELWFLFRESIEKNELDQKAEEWGVKEKKIPISEQLAQDLTIWREALTKDINYFNKEKYGQEEIDEAVQRFLDRLIFIRYTEDKNLEPLTLLPLLREWKVSGKGNLIEELNKIFRKFDKWYDSRLFEKHFSEDLESYGPLEDIVEGLYHSKKSGHPYDFSVISSDVLGAVYEQYLGYLQKKEGGKEENGRKSKRKQQGIYYTPTFVVDYIVKNTLGKILQEKSSEEIKNIRVLDPACGSGSFLIKACQTLIDYWQNQKREIKGSSKLDEIAKIMEKKAGQKILPTPAKLRILRENIFGVDLDPKAEEIAQLNLLLNAVSRRTLLPNLSHNITCGNSLISGTPKELKNYFGENWKDKKPFNWEEEFPEIFKDGGFDVVIGNPPYIMVENLPSNERRYLMSKYETAAKRFDIYITFIEKGLDLLKPGGFLSFIIPYPFLNQNYAEKLRKKILQDFNLIHILDLSEVKIFGDAIIRNCIIVIEKPRAGNDKKDKINVKKIYNEKDLSNLGNLPTRVFLKSIFKSLPKAMFRTDLNNLKMNLLEKIESKSISLGQICYVNWGARTGDIKKYVTKEKNNEYCKKMINARNVDRYIINYTNDYIIYKKEELYNPMFEELFESPKIVTRDISGKSRLKSALDTERYYTEHTVSLVVPFYYLKEVKRRGLKLTDEQINTSYNYDLKYILAIVNSALLNWYFISKLGGGLHVYPDDVKQFPIYKINFSNNEEKGKYDELVKLVDGILNLNKELQEIAKDSDKYHKIQQEIEKIDKEIDQKIYKLYGLVDEEIKIIEGK